MRHYSAEIVGKFGEEHEEFVMALAGDERVLEEIRNEKSVMKTFEDEFDECEEKYGKFQGIRVVSLEEYEDGEACYLSMVRKHGESFTFMVFWNDNEVWVEIFRNWAFTHD